ncbi:MAG TPA: ABC transporter ATP-binding protein [Gaiellaceae bacterium]|nr:ABC transporter ATP-binding protein [Gaiellaceae bacterium]
MGQQAPSTLRAGRGAGTPGASPAVSMRGITKRFPGVLANDAVDFEAAAGEVHALLGENGAGKSTLSNILTGLYTPDEGEIRLYGEPVQFDSPSDAIDAGIGMVHQHFRLVPPFTVAENIILGEHRDEARRFLINPRQIEKRVAALGGRYGLAVDPGARVWQLSVGEQQRVEILKALYREARILILDEPTAVLTPQEAEALFETLRTMAAEGRTVIFISHKLHEVKAVADRVTVLRGGRSIATVAAADASTRELAALMVGRDVELATRIERGAPPGDAPALEVEELSVRGDRGEQAVRGLTFTLRHGEILGFAGVSGNGQRELAEAITGMRPAAGGAVRVHGRALRLGDPRAAIRAGIAHVPEDRLGTGVAPSLTIAENTVLKSYRGRDVSRGPLLRWRAIRERAAELIQRYRVAAPGPQARARDLSGGNLQKLVLGRELTSIAPPAASHRSSRRGGERQTRAAPTLSEQPSVLIAASPTRGLDVGAIETVHAYLRQAAADGVAVVLISEDLDEIRALADRILVLYEGRVTGEFDPETATVEEIGLAMAGGDA